MIGLRTELSYFKFLHSGAPPCPRIFVPLYLLSKAQIMLLHLCYEDIFTKAKIKINKNT